MSSYKWHLSNREHSLPVSEDTFPLSFAAGTEVVSLALKETTFKRRKQTLYVYVHIRWGSLSAPKDGFELVSTTTTKSPMLSSKT